MAVISVKPLTTECDGCGSALAAQRYELRIGNMQVKVCGGCLARLREAIDTLIERGGRTDRT